MDWNQSTMYEQRVRFILEVQQRTFSFAESCRRYGISRTAGYTWWTRFLAEGFEGLHDRSHRPHHCPHAIADPIVEHVVDLRQRYGWGSRKIRKLTAEKFGGAPARRTIDRIFERHDLITKKRRRSGKPGHPGKPLTPMDEPNAVWTVDFKGQFKMLNGRYCYPLTIQDGFSRFLLECQGVVFHVDRACQARVHQRFPRVRPSRRHPLRQRDAFRVHRPRSPHSAERLVDPARHPS